MSLPIDGFSAEIIATKTLFTIFGKLGSDFIKKLIDTKIVVSKGVTIYHKSSEIEFAFMLSLGAQHSRTNSIINKISSILNKPVEFENVIDAHGFGLEQSENLLDAKMIVFEKNKTIIDFAKIMRDIKSDTVFLKIRKKIPEDLKQLLVVNRLNKTSRYIGKQFVETDIEIILDYADLWHKRLDQYTVRDIEFDFNLEISTETIVEHIPKNIREKIIKSAQSSSKNKDAISFLSIMMETFVLFESESILKKLLNTIVVEPSDSFQIVSVTPSMKKMEIASIGYPIVLPGMMKIVIACRLEDKEIAKTGILRIDLQKFGEVVSGLVLILQQKTNKLKIS